MEKYLYECKVRPGVRSPWLWIKDVKWMNGEIIVTTCSDPCYVCGVVAFACSSLFHYAKGAHFHSESVVSRVDSFNPAVFKEDQDHA